MVKKEGQFFTVEDRETKLGEGGERTLANDILFKPRAKTIQNVKSVLGKYQVGIMLVLVELALAVSV